MNNSIKNCECVTNSFLGAFLQSSSTTGAGRKPSWRQYRAGIDLYRFALGFSMRRCTSDINMQLWWTCHDTSRRPHPVMPFTPLHAHLTRHTLHTTPIARPPYHLAFKVTTRSELHACNSVYSIFFNSITESFLFILSMIQCTFLFCIFSPRYLS